MPIKHGRREKYTPFIDLSRKKRGRATLAIRHVCARLKPLLGGRFVSSYWEGCPRLPEEGCQWFDCFFPGLDKFTFWNVEIITARTKFYDLVRRMANDRANSLLTEEERESLVTFPDKIDENGKTYSTLEFNDSPFLQFGGLSYMGFTERTAREIAAGEPPTVYEEFKIDTGYAYGIGLHIVVDAENITKDVIEQAIDRFTAVGQKDWKSPEPVPAEHLQGVEFPWIQAMVGYLPDEDVSDKD